MHGVDRCLEQCEQRFAPPIRQARRAAPGKAVQQAAHLIEVAHFGGVQLAHEHARMLARDHQARAFQLAQRFAHRHPRNLQAAGHVRLIDALARHQYPFQDHRQHVVADQLGQRDVAHGVEMPGGGFGQPGKRGGHVWHPLFRIRNRILPAKRGKNHASSLIAGI
jgi:hypothetical protein